ncbi:DUF4352 domain-containing protein [Priestia megaterium]
MAREKKEKVKKPFYKKWWVWVIAAIVVFALIPTDDDSTTTTESTESTDTDSNSSEVSAKPAKKKEEAPKTFGIQQEVNVDKFAYTVNSVEETKQITAQYLDPITSDSGKFIIVNVTFKNNDKTSRMLDTELFKLTTADGTEYSASSDADFNLNGDATMFLEEVNPNATRTGKIAFEVPADATEYNLNVSSGLGWSGGDYANIKLK